MIRMRPQKKQRDSAPFGFQQQSLLKKLPLILVLVDWVKRMTLETKLTCPMGYGSGKCPMGFGGSAMTTAATATTSMPIAEKDRVSTAVLDHVYAVVILFPWTESIQQSLLEALDKSQDLNCTTILFHWRLTDDAETTEMDLSDSCMKHWQNWLQSWLEKGRFIISIVDTALSWNHPLVSWLFCSNTKQRDQIFILLTERTALLVTDSSLHVIKHLNFFYKRPMALGVSVLSTSKVTPLIALRAPELLPSVDAFMPTIHGTLHQCLIALLDALNKEKETVPILVKKVLQSQVHYYPGPSRLSPHQSIMESLFENVDNVSLLKEKLAQIEEPYGWIREMKNWTEEEWNAFHEIMKQ